MADVKGSRREKSRATRQKILEAAERVFVESGFHGATIAAIAARAGVATQTVYFVFHTKAELISAAIDSLVLGDDPTIPQDTEWWRAMSEAPDSANALEIFVRGAAPLFQRASTLSEVLRGAALTDDELRKTHEHHERLREAGFREVIEVVAAKGSLREDLTVDTATDVLLVTLSDASYVQFTTERGWTHEQVVDAYCVALPRLLLATPDSA